MATQPPERRLVTEATLDQGLDTLLDDLGEQQNSALDAHTQAMTQATEAMVPPLVAQSIAADDTPAQAAAAAVQAKVADLDIIQSLHVARIVAIPHGAPVPALQEGDMVLRYNMAGTNYYEDFTSPDLDATPPGFTPRWDALTTTATVVSDAGATGGRSLEVDHTTNDRQLLSWDLIDTDPDRANVEVLIRWRTDRETAVGGIAARASGDGTSETGYRGGGSNTHATVTKYVNAEFTLLDDFYKSPPVPGDWYLTRTRIHGDALQVRTWADSEPEPQDWLAQAVDDSITDPGWVGLSSTQHGVIHYDFIAVGTAGRPAVRP